MDVKCTRYGDADFVSQVGSPAIRHFSLINRLSKLFQIDFLFLALVHVYLEYGKSLVTQPNWFIHLTAESLANRFNRRKSVFAESYDPEGDDDEGEKVCLAYYSSFAGFLRSLYTDGPLRFAPLQVVYPKSDQQRHRLAEAVKNIFLFRSLDPVSHAEILLMKNRKPGRA